MYLRFKLVILLEHHGADQSDDGRIIGEDANHIGPAVDSG
jgi:hypothetical protein